MHCAQSRIGKNLPGQFGLARVGGNASGGICLRLRAGQHRQHDAGECGGFYGLTNSHLDLFSGWN